jgi:hypothetical protein
MLRQICLLHKVIFPQVFPIRLHPPLIILVFKVRIGQLLRGKQSFLDPIRIEVADNFPKLFGELRVNFDLTQDSKVVDRLRRLFLEN